MFGGRVLDLSCGILRKNATSGRTRSFGQWYRGESGGGRVSMVNLWAMENAAWSIQYLRTTRYYLAELSKKERKNI